MFSEAYQHPPEDHDALARAMDASIKQDRHILQERGFWPPPWQDADYILQQDEARLLSAIADHMGLAWSDSNQCICQATTNAIGMVAIGNAKAVLKRCHDLGYIEFKFDEAENVFKINLTFLGRDLLDEYEDENHS